jgi:hypothetical protein
MSFGRLAQLRSKSFLNDAGHHPACLYLPDSGLSPEVVARLVRMTGGNLRLLTQLLTQVERVLGVNDTKIPPYDK